MKNTKEIKQEQAGITLIVVVIAIVVLLILAGVSIAMLAGNNGILNQAKLAKENTALAKKEEENKLAKNNEYIDEQTGKVVKPGKTATKTEKNNYSDGTDTATIPEGFTVDENEKTISKGLVVYGPDRSEFVWVPVPDINSMSQCSIAGGSCNLQLEEGILKCKTHNNNEEIVGKLYATDIGEKFGTVNTTYNANEGLREPAYLTNSDYSDASIYNTIGLTLLDMQDDYRNMAISVAKYGGFYVGRYETSLSNSTSSQANDGTAQSKPGLIPTFSTQNSTSSMWYGLYRKQKEYTGKNNSIESSMIWGSQYDAVLNWAIKGADKDKITNKSLGNKSIEGVTTTGNSDYSDDSINNIRDLGGNLGEWTLEACSTKYRVYRGGIHGGYTFSPSFRDGNISAAISNGYGSRLTLYIK